MFQNEEYGIRGYATFLNTLRHNHKRECEAILDRPYVIAYTNQTLDFMPRVLVNHKKAKDILDFSSEKLTNKYNLEVEESNGNRTISIPAKSVVTLVDCDSYIDIQYDKLSISYVNKDDAEFNNIFTIVRI